MRNIEENGLEISLAHAGIPEESRKMMLEMQECGCEAELLIRLKMHRCRLMDEMHDIQRKIDSTDDLIRMHRR